jgi:hypothetical protein
MLSVGLKLVSTQVHSLVWGGGLVIVHLASCVLCANPFALSCIPAFTQYTFEGCFPSALGMCLCMMHEGVGHIKHDLA